MGVRLFVGSNAWRVQGEQATLAGDRCFTAAHPPPRLEWDPAAVTALLDSGAFTDPPAKRLSFEAALDRQRFWERQASDRWGQTWQARYLASYDWLIDETWVDGVKHKRRWSVGEAEQAVDETVAAAAYLTERRRYLAPRTLVLGVQGVDAEQYARCARQVLQVAAPGDWIGFGGWCILGRWKSWLPVFWAAMRATLPQVRAAGLSHVHLYGVLWEPALAGLLWLADREGLTVSTDSAAPLLASTRGDAHKAGIRAAGGWRANVDWWTGHLAGLRGSRWYGEPPAARGRQLAMEGL